MSAADSRIGDGVFIPVRSIDSLQPQSSALLLKGRPGRRYSVKVNVFRLSMSVLTADGATRHLAFLVLLRFRFRSVSTQSKLSTATPRRARNCGPRRRLNKKPTKKKCCIQDTREKGNLQCLSSNQKYNHRLLSPPKEYIYELTLLILIIQ